MNKPLSTTCLFLKTDQLFKLYFFTSRVHNILLRFYEVCFKTYMRMLTALKKKTKKKTNPSCSVEVCYAVVFDTDLSHLFWSDVFVQSLILCVNEGFD